MPGLDPGIHDLKEGAARPQPYRFSNSASSR